MPSELSDIDEGPDLLYFPHSDLVEILGFLQDKHASRQEKREEIVMFRKVNSLRYNLSHHTDV